MPKPNDFAPPMADYEFPKPVGAASNPPTVAESQFVAVVLSGDEHATIRIALSQDESGDWSATMQHEYADLDPVGLTFQVGESVYEVTQRKGRVLSLEVA